MKKIVFTGPESTGKTTLTELLARNMKIPFVKEIAREYINNLNRPYEYDDLLNIAMLQMSEEEKIISLQPPILICDTDVLTIKIWSEDKFNKCESWLTHASVDRAADIYFLCVPDFSWQKDAQREDEYRREYLFNIYKEHLINYKRRFVELSGDINKRMETVIHCLNFEGK